MGWDAIETSRDHADQGLGHGVGGIGGCCTLLGAQRLKGLEKENARLKKLVADLSLDKDILNEALKGNY